MKTINNLFTLIFSFLIAASLAQTKNLQEVHLYNTKLVVQNQSIICNIQPINQSLIAKVKPQSVNDQKGKYHLSGCKKYQATIKLTDNSKSLKGCLYSVGSSSISFYPNHMLKKTYNGVLLPLNINYEQIEQIKLYKSGNIGKGLGFGALAGFVIGATVTGILYSNSNGSLIPSVGVACLAGGAMGSIPGLLVGGVVGGSVGVKIKVKGDKDKFKANRKRLKLYDAK